MDISSLTKSHIFSNTSYDKSGGVKKRQTHINSEPNNPESRSSPLTDGQLLHVPFQPQPEPGKDRVHLFSSLSFMLHFRLCLKYILKTNTFSLPSEMIENKDTTSTRTVLSFVYNFFLHLTFIKCFDSTKNNSPFKVLQLFEKHSIQFILWFDFFPPKCDPRV